MKLVPLLCLFAAGHAGAFEIGQIQRLTDQRYLIPVEVAADGYSTFSAQVYAETTLAQSMRTQTVEQNPGALIYVSFDEPVVSPEMIQVVATYQGLRRVRDYELVPMIPIEEPVTDPQAEAPDLLVNDEADFDALALAQGWLLINAMQDQEIPIEAEPVLHAGTPECVDQRLEVGTLLSNIDRIFAVCKRTLDGWPLRDGNLYVDFMIPVMQSLPPPGGLDQLFRFIRDEFGLAPQVSHSLPGALVSFVEFREPIAVEIVDSTPVLSPDTRIEAEVNDSLKLPVEHFQETGRK